MVLTAGSMFWSCHTMVPVINSILQVVWVRLIFIILLIYTLKLKQLTRRLIYFFGMIGQLDLMLLVLWWVINALNAAAKY